MTGPLVFSPSINIGTITPNQNINIGTSTSTLNVIGGLVVNAIGGSTVASTVKYKKYGKIVNYSVPAGSPTTPYNGGTSVAIAGFTSADVPYLYVYVSLINSGLYNCTATAGINATGTAISIYLTNINTSAAVCQIYWSL